MNELNEFKAKSLGTGDPGFPRRLKGLKGLKSLNGLSMKKVFIKGDPGVLEGNLSVAIVGTRNPSQAGAQKAEEFAKALGDSKILVVSGLAYGCDIAAHRGSLKSQHPQCSCAVLAHGLDRIYPGPHLPEAEAILQAGGALVSEHPEGAPPQRRFFVERNRIQAALADVIIIAESGLQGGTMHTARFAAQQGKALAVLDIEAAGNLKLASVGAKTLKTPQDAIELAMKEFRKRLAR